jgi:RNA binding exosome subunit
VNNDEIKNKWREYFDKLFNEESEKIMTQLDNSFDDANKRFVRRIQKSEVKEDLKKMKTGKVLGPDDISIEIWRCLGDVVIM